MNLQRSCAQGSLVGARDQDALVFRGIPFAAPPTGANRFQPPAPPQPWAGVRDATRVHPAPPQTRGALLATRPVDSWAEDCLTLDLWCPQDLDNRAGLPVLLWLFGGMFSNGWASDPSSNGARLASNGRMLVVCANYRLGALGWAQVGAANDGLGGSANNGLRDQLAALRWVAANIRGFGGDPNRVCLAGESAGAMSVAALLASPESKGLVQRAICQSGAAMGLRPPAVVARASSQLQHSLAPAAAQDVPVEALLAAQDSLGKTWRRDGQPAPFRPTLDPVVLPEHPLTAARRGVGAGVPLLLGMNLDEQRLYLRPKTVQTQAELLASLASRLQGLSSTPEALALEFANTYSASRRALGERADPAAIHAAILGDLGFRRPLQALLAARTRHHPGNTWRYLFNGKSPALNGWLGACHAVEIPHVFRTLDAPGMARFAGNSAAAQRLSQDTQAAWTAFVHGQPQWPAWTASDQTTLVLDHQGARAEQAWLGTEEALLNQLPDPEPET